MKIVLPSDAALGEAGERIRAGGLVAFPTETVYGLGADATNSEAVARVFEAKGRPRFNPLIVHVPDLAAAEAIACFTPAARMLAQAFWPGPLTLVVRRRAEAGISDLVSAGLETIAVRVPAHPVARALLKSAGRPIAAPSANRSGRVSPTEAHHVAADLAGRVDVVLDGGPCVHGLESTVIDAAGTDIAMLRPGAIPRAKIEARLGASVGDGAQSAMSPSAPGQLESHYAPMALMRLEALTAGEGEALLAFGPNVPKTTGPVANLSPKGDLVEAAANLFAALRRLDAAGVSVIAVMPIPNEGLGEAINDRLARAAAPRG